MMTRILALQLTFITRNYACAKFTNASNPSDVVICFGPEITTNLTKFEQHHLPDIYKHTKS